MKFLDIFSGIGGFRLGLEMAGHECVGHIEIDKYANKSYTAMHNPKEDEYFGEDITKIESRDLPNADIWCGGFCCQSFSIAGKRQGFEDTRGTVIFDVLRLAKEKRPKILFLENVRGLLNHDKGRTFGSILLAIRDAGYDQIEWCVINSKNYGVPQNRERVFIIAYLRGERRRKIFPLERNDGKTNGKLKELIPGTMAERVYDEDGISKNLIGLGGGLGAKTGLYLVTINRGNIIKRNNFTCLNATYYKGLDNHSARTGILENKRIRRLTPKECFRLQGFPDEYFERARMVNSDSQLYKQAGNGVTVNVIYEIAKKL